MSCDTGCLNCSGGSKKITITNINYPKDPIPKNTTVDIDVTITAQGTYIGGALVCLHDGDSCIDSQSVVFTIGYTDTVHFSVPMPNHDLSLKVSVIEVNYLVSNSCLDTKYVYCELAPCTNCTYNCGTYGCQEVDGTGGKYPSLDVCKSSGCAAEQSLECKKGEMNVLGVCLPEPVIFVGALAIVAIMLSGRK